MPGWVDTGMTLPGAVLAPVALTDGATVNTDAALSRTFRLTAAGNRTLAAPTNAVDGRMVTWEITASGADRTLALATGTGGFTFGSDIAGLTATVSSKTDYIGAKYNSTAQRWHVIAYVKGY